MRKHWWLQLIDKAIIPIIAGLRVRGPSILGAH